MVGYEVHTITEPMRPNLVCYLPHSIKPDFAVALYPGFGREPSFYHRIAELFAEDNTLTTITEWHDAGQFSDETMTESVYYLADYLRKELKCEKVMGAGHSYGGEKLLKAAVKDREKRFAGITVIQPPEKLGKYIGNHSFMYRMSKKRYAKLPILLWARIRHSGLRIRTLRDQERLLDLIDHDSSMFDAINAADSFSTPVQFVYSFNDGHVEPEDAINARQLVSQKGAYTEPVELQKLDKALKDRQMEAIFQYARDFYRRITNNVFDQSAVPIPKLAPA